MDNKPHFNIWKFLITLLFIIFLITYILGVSGYYETKMQEKTVYTSEQIEQFEQDIQAGKQVDLNNYVDTTSKNYSNGYTQTGDKLGNFVTDIVTNGFGDAWNAIKFLFL